MLIGSYNIGLLKMPAFVEDLFGLGNKGPDTRIPGDEGKLYEALQNALNDENASTVLDYDVTNESLLKAVTESQPPNQYTAVYTIRHVSEATEKKEFVRIWKNGERYMIRISDENDVKTSEIYCGYDTVKITIYTDGSTTVRSYPKSEGFSLESEAGIPSITEFLTDINVKDLEITLRRAIDLHIYHAQYGYLDSDQKESLYISLEHNLVISAETTVNGKSVYSCVMELIEPEIIGIEFPEE